ncbi:MAG: FAD-binding oxidoreductase [Candidatus Omnitrophica bacterium]|jgi:ferredoxin-NADP reductase|nr:FAD-binding oxidoreductase [Candidatus Omnitrophota bacterium]MDD3274645.1 FAD-binding oxidoreductase [Candidatus Omnitrophota bacterium]MDD5077913.1 FAD-binding oxidoreductase [Candidatus Omnitrophota bacterium]MDD5724604.1 FAD-binding oxidoreductase [Candidatus Omnitrophota bacterium]
MTIEITSKIKEIIRRNYNVKSFRLEIPAGAPDFKAGQFLSVSLGNDPQFKRYLSISSSPTEKCYLEFTKKLTESSFSRALDSLSAGDTLRIQFPFGKFILDESFPKIAFLSGGIGITPIRSICKYAVDKNLGIDIVLVYSNRSVRDVVFKEDFDAMVKSYPRLKVAHVLCEADPGFKCRVGLINAGVIKNEIPDYEQRKFYLCGPPQMVEAMYRILSEELGLKEDMVVRENFQGY